MKLHTSALALSLLGALACQASAQATDFEDYARVISVTPQVEQINSPHQNCHTEYETIQRQQPGARLNERGNGGAVVGGIAGGLLGSQVGGGNGRLAATAAGAIVGALAGDRIENNNNGGYTPPQTVYENRPVRRCYNDDRWETRTVGYAVTYEYHNRTYTAIMPYDPGNRLRLRVSLMPMP